MGLRSQPGTGTAHVAEIVSELVPASRKMAHSKVGGRDAVFQSRAPWSGSEPTFIIARIVRLDEGKLMGKLMGKWPEGWPPGVT